MNLPFKESRDITKFLARKRNIKNYKHKSSNELLQTVKENNQQQKIKSKNKKREELKELSELKESNQQQKIKSKNKKRIDIIRDELEELSYRLSRKELKEIKKNLNNIEKRNQFGSKTYHLMNIKKK